MKGLLYAGKGIEEMSREELISCAVHFHDAHTRTVQTASDMARRISKLEEGYTKEEIAALDLWLHDHHRDILKGDGTELYADWRSTSWTEFAKSKLRKRT